ncbi:UNVERIFIED_CONTAM: hypothetical protein FKN15_066443 [Acipenser sinensis]
MLDMDQGVVEEWLSEFKTLPETAIPSYAAGLKDKASLVSALYRVIQEPQSELLEPVCHQLFEFYRSGDVSLQRFTLQFLPEFIWSYLSTCTSRDLHSTGCREALLLGIYNLVHYWSVRLLPAPPDTTAVARAPHRAGPCIGHRCTSTGRFEVLTFLLLCYNAALSYMTSASLQSLCHLSTGISICGYPRQLLRKYKGVSNRMPVSSEFLVQLITSLYYALYNGEWDMASKALDDVLYRAQLELYPEPLLVGNAIKSSLPGGALKSNKEGTRCIQVEITPTSSRISRNAVTSLSIRGHRWKRNAITFLLSSSLLDSSENSIDIPDSAALSVPEISVTGVLGERVGNGETQRSRGEGEAQGGQDSGADSRADSKGLAERAISCYIPDMEKDHKLKHGSLPVTRRAITFLLSSSLLDSSENSIDIPDSAALSVPEINAVDLTSPEELMEISEMDEGFCSRAASNASPPVITISSSSGKTPGKSQRKSGSSRAGFFSRSFEQVSNIFGANNPASTGNTTSTEANRYSACSLQEEKLAYVSERTELLGPSSRHKQRSPSIGIQLSADL